MCPARGTHSKTFYSLNCESQVCVSKYVLCHIYMCIYTLSIIICFVVCFMCFFVCLAQMPSFVARLPGVRRRDSPEQLVTHGTIIGMGDHSGRAQGADIVLLFLCVVTPFHAVQTM